MHTRRFLSAMLLGLLALGSLDRLATARAEEVVVEVGPSDVAPMQGDACGDGRCAPPEDCRSCEADCGDCCGDGRCAPPEDHRSCPRDC